MRPFPSTVTIADATTFTPNPRYDRCVQTNTQAGGTLTVASPSNAGLAPGQRVELVIKTTNIQTYSFGGTITNLASGGPSASTAGKTDRILLEWNELSSKWDIIAYATN